MIFLFYIDNLLDISFKKIEDIITRAYNPIYVRQSIAKRFALILPEDHEYVNVGTHGRKRSSGGIVLRLQHLQREILLLSLIVITVNQKM